MGDGDASSQSEADGKTDEGDTKRGSRPTSIRSAIMAWASGFRIVEHRGASWSIAADSGELAIRRCRGSVVAARGNIDPAAEANRIPRWRPGT